MTRISGLIYDAKAVGIVGTRSPTPEQKRSCVKHARILTERGLQLISGGARGIDTLAETSFTGEARIFRPEFIDRELTPGQKKKIERIAAQNHPNWEAVCRKGYYVKKLMMRNVLIVIYADVIIAFPGTTSGGTDHTISVAKYLEVPVDINPGIT